MEGVLNPGWWVGIISGLSVGYTIGMLFMDRLWKRRIERDNEQRRQTEQMFFVYVRTAISSDSAELILTNLGKTLRELASENIQLQVDTDLTYANVIRTGATKTLTRRADEIERTYAALVAMHAWFKKVGENVAESVNAYTVLPPSPPTP